MTSPLTGKNITCNWGRGCMITVRVLFRRKLLLEWGLLWWCKLSACWPWCTVFRATTPPVRPFRRWRSILWFMLRWHLAEWRRWDNTFIPLTASASLIKVRTLPSTFLVCWMQAKTFIIGIKTASFCTPASRLKVLSAHRFSISSSLGISLGWFCNPVPLCTRAHGPIPNTTRAWRMLSSWCPLPAVKKKHGSLHSK